MNRRWCNWRTTTRRGEDIHDRHPSTLQGLNNKVPMRSRRRNRTLREFFLVLRVETSITPSFRIVKYVVCYRAGTQSKGPITKKQRVREFKAEFLSSNHCALQLVDDNNSEGVCGGELPGSLNERDVERTDID